MIVYGKQIFLYILEKHKELIQEVHLAKEIDSKLFHKIRGLNVPIIKLDNKRAQANARGANHQGFFLKIKDIKLQELKSVKNYNFVIVLVGISDMGNIGSIIRSAYSLGADGVIISGIDELKIPQIIRSSSGAMIDCDVVAHKDSSDTVNTLKSYGYKIYSTSMNGKDINSIKFSSKVAVLMGSEGYGLPNRLIKNSDIEIKIPMKREFNSLNVSNAASIIVHKVIND